MHPATEWKFDFLRFKKAGLDKKSRGTEIIAKNVKAIVFLPTFNEIDNLKQAVENVLTQNLDLDILIVDDDSPDGTGGLADKLSEQYERVRVLHRSEKNGLGRAYITAFQQELSKEYTHFIQMDVDGSHRAGDLPALLKAAPESELVIGSRWVTGGAVQNWPLSRQLISRVGNTYVTIMLGLKLKDSTGGFRIYSKELLMKIPLDEIAAKGYAYQIEMTFRAVNLCSSIQEVPITFIERTRGDSKMTVGIILEALVLVTKWGLQRLSKARLQ